MSDLRVENLRYCYPDGTEALRGLSFHVTSGECLGLIGPNGAGKSTLLASVLGFIPAEGIVRVGDLELGRKTLHQIRSQVGIVFQDADDQLFMPTVFDDVAFGPLCHGLDEKEVRSRVAEALAAVGATEMADRAPYHLSGGEKRRVALATVLAMRPEVVLLDEPSSSLDPRSRRQLIRLMQAMDCTRVVASHDLEMILELCSRVVLVSGGRTVADGPAPGILADASLMSEHGLEVPPSLRPHRDGQAG